MLGGSSLEENWNRTKLTAAKESETWKQNENVRVHFLVIVNVKYSTQQQHGSTVHGWMGTKAYVFSTSIDDIQFPISIRLTRVEAIKAGTEKGFFTAIIQLWTVLLRLRARWRGFSFQVSALHYILSFSRIGQLIPFLVIDLYTHGRLSFLKTFLPPPISPNIRDCCMWDIINVFVSLGV